MNTIFRLSCLVILMTPSLAHRNGARNESCYGHEIDHFSAVLTNVKQLCSGSCLVSLTLIDEVNKTDFSQLLNAGVAGNYNLSCDSVYRFDFGVINTGYLIQARQTEGDQFVAGSNIVGEWLLDPSMANIPYQTLDCGRNMSAPTPVFPNSATHTNVFQTPSVTLYWRAPNETMSIRFFYSIVVSYNTFYFPLVTPQMTVSCDDEPGAASTVPEDTDSTEGTTSMGSTSSASGYQLGGVIMTFALTLPALLN